MVREMGVPEFTYSCVFFIQANFEQVQKMKWRATSGAISSCASYVTATTLFYPRLAFVFHVLLIRVY